MAARVKKESNAIRKFKMFYGYTKNRRVNILTKQPSTGQYSY